MVIPNQYSDQAKFLPVRSESSIERFKVDIPDSLQ